MPRLPDAVVGDALTNDHAWDVLADLVEVENRMAGQGGEREGARVVADALADVGLDPSTDTFEIPGWWRGASSLAVDPPRNEYAKDHEVIALPGTPAGSVEAPLVDVGHGVPDEVGDEVEGAVAMARSDIPDDHDRWIHRMEKYAAAARAGAVGFVFRNHVDGCLPPTGEVGYHERPGPIPAVGVSKELGDRLERYADDGADVALSVDCRNEPAESQNVEATVGPDTDREVLVTAHVDAHDIVEGASDNGAGCALVVAVGRLLSRVADDLDTRVRLVTFGAEEIGLYGAYRWAGTHDDEAVKAVLNIDGAGTSREPRVGSNGFDAVVAPIERAADRFDAPLEVSRETTPHADDWAFVERGIPAVTIGSTSEGSGRGWGHTHADTLDKLDPRDLRALAAIYAEAALELADGDTELPHHDVADVRDRLDENYVTELEAGGRWHFDGRRDR